MLVKYYMVIMYRYGDHHSHAYCIGYSQDLLVAGIAGRMERDYRGGKYEFEIQEVVRERSSKLYLVEQHNDESKYGEDYSYRASLLTKEEADQKTSKIRKHTKITLMEEGIPLTETEILAAHQNISWYTTEEQAYLRDKYEPIARKQLEQILAYNT